MVKGCGWFLSPFAAPPPKWCTSKGVCMQFSHAHLQGAAKGRVLVTGEQILSVIKAVFEGRGQCSAVFKDISKLLRYV